MCRSSLVGLNALWRGTVRRTSVSMLAMNHPHPGFPAGTLARGLVWSHGMNPDRIDQIAPAAAHPLRLQNAQSLDTQ
jgi:hypothetical protein